MSGGGDLDREDWKLFDTYIKRRRSERRDAAPAVLKAYGASFTSHNVGAHLIVEGRYDFWPGTDRWKERPPGKREGRGLWPLLHNLGLDRGSSSG